MQRLQIVVKQKVGIGERITSWGKDTNCGKAEPWGRDNILGEVCADGGKAEGWGRANILGINCGI